MKFKLNFKLTCIMVNFTVYIISNSKKIAISHPFSGYSVDKSNRVVIIPTMDSKAIIKLLEQDGWTLRGVKGSHHVYVHPLRGGHISVPHPKNDMGKGIVHKLLKQAGLK